MEKKYTLVPVIVKITRMLDGLSVEFEDSLYTTEDYDGIYIWESGNYSCDCNRDLFFNRALGKLDNDDIDCGHWKYRVDFIKDTAGRVLYTEL